MYADPYFKNTSFFSLSYWQLKLNRDKERSIQFSGDIFCLDQPVKSLSLWIRQLGYLKINGQTFIGNFMGQDNNKSWKVSKIT